MAESLSPLTVFLTTGETLKCLHILTLNMVSIFSYHSQVFQDQFYHNLAYFQGFLALS